MKTIYKYALIPGKEYILVPKGAQLLSCGVDPQDDPCVWAVVDTQETEEVKIPIGFIGTGHKMQSAGDISHELGWKFLGSFTMRTRPLVWHIFYKEDPA